MIDVRYVRFVAVAVPWQYIGYFWILLTAFPQVSGVARDGVEPSTFRFSVA